MLIFKTRNKLWMIQGRKDFFVSCPHPSLSIRYLYMHAACQCMTDKDPSQKLTLMLRWYKTVILKSKIRTCTLKQDYKKDEYADVWKTKAIMLRVAGHWYECQCFIVTGCHYISLLCFFSTAQNWSMKFQGMKYWQTKSIS